MLSATRVKICGITEAQHARKAAEVGVDAIGLVFYEPSVRYVSDFGVARDIALAAGPFVTVTGLFVNAEIEYIEKVLTEVPLSLLQFHGDEEEQFCRAFKRPYIKALRMKPGIELDKEIAKYSDASGILLDAYQPGVPGGTGESFDWNRIETQGNKPIILAGGLTPDNVEGAVKAVKPWAVDVSGGVESARGVKSEKLMSEFIINAKSQCIWDSPN